MMGLQFSMGRTAIGLTLLFISGCGQPVKAPEAKTLSAAQQKFLDICAQEHSLKVNTKSFPHTFWIYLPVEHRLVDYKSTQDGPKKSKERSEKFVANYIDAVYKNGAFEIEYDISKSTSYPISYGYSSIYTDEYQQTQTKILGAFYRAYAGLKENLQDQEKSFEEKAESYEDFFKGLEKENKPPEFVVLIIADVQKGLEIMSLFSFEDFFLAMVDPQVMPQEEFSRRNISDLRGQDTVIGDYQGTHVNYEDITWPEFLAKQIVNRVRFQYQYSDFKPEEDHEEELLRIVAQTTGTYHYTDFSAVNLYDLATKTPYRFTPDQLKSFLSE